MKKYLIIFSVFLLGIALVGCDFSNTTQPITTEVTTTEPTELLLVSTVDELKAMDVTKSYILTTDLDLNGAEWDPIGTPNNPFKGWFDGDNHTISNYVITEKNDNYNGFFGVVTGKILNLTVSNFSINYSTDFMTYAGGLVALDMHLLEHREFHAIGQGAEILDFLFAARILAHEVVGRKAQHGKALFAVFGVQRLQGLELRGVTAFAGGIDHQQHLAAVSGAQIDLFFPGQGAVLVVQDIDFGGTGGTCQDQPQSNITQ